MKCTTKHIFIELGWLKSKVLTCIAMLYVCIPVFLQRLFGKFVTWLALIDFNMFLNDNLFLVDQLLYLREAFSITHIWTKIHQEECYSTYMNHLVCKFWLCTLETNIFKGMPRVYDVPGSPQSL